MALDATGTPTSPDNIPKYNTAVDPPSGKGFNAAMDQIQVALSARVDKPSGIASGEVSVWNGSAWVRSSVTRVGATSLIPAGRGTSLPTSPYDGQEFVLTDSLTAPTYNWRFRYNAGSTSAYKWEFVGGAPLTQVVNTQENTTSSAFVELATALRITVPVAGDYRIEQSIAPEIGSGGSTSLAQMATWNETLAGDTGVCYITQALNGVGHMNEAGNFGIATALNAGHVLSQRYRNLSGVSTNFSRRKMSILPIRVS